uniref:Uncharacterized protein n=1 Tax=Oryza brachyantha TaxID=4533 RepID=J3N9W1_ORYBR
MPELAASWGSLAGNILCSICSYLVCWRLIGNTVLASCCFPCPRSSSLVSPGDGGSAASICCLSFLAVSLTIFSWSHSSIFTSWGRLVARSEVSPG